MEAKFGSEGIALVERLGEITDLTRLEALVIAAAVAGSLGEIRRLFKAPRENG